MGLYLKRTTFLFLLIIIPTVLLYAQDRIPVDDDIMQRYAESKADMLSPDNIVLADSLYDIGEKRNDYRVKILALQVELFPQYVSGNEDRVKAIADEIEEIGLGHPDVQDIYIASHTQLIHLMSCSEDIVPATEFARRLFDNCHNLSKSSQFQAYRALAEIYSARKDFLSERNCYEEAIALYSGDEIECSPETLVSFYLSVSENLINLHRFDEARDAILKAEKAAKECSEENQELVRYMIEVLRFIICFDSDEYVLAAECFERILEGGGLDRYETEDRKAAYMAKYFHSKGEPDRALAYLSQCGVPELQDEIGERIYAETGDYKRAYEASQRVAARVDSLMYLANNADEAYFEKELELDRLHAENIEIKVKNQKLISLLVLLIIVFMFSLLARKYLRQRSKIKFMHGVSQSRTECIEAITKCAIGPLSRILVASDMLRNSYGELSQKDTDESADLIVSECGRLLRLLDDTEFSASNSDNKDIFSLNCSFNLNELCYEAIHEASSGKPSGLELKYVSGVAQNYELKSDPRRLSALLGHLLDRAMESEGCGAVTLETILSDGGQELCLSVSDNGKLASAEHFEMGKLQKFNSMLRFDKRLGLNLSMCLSLASQLGGEIRLDEGYVGGTRFILTIPINTRSEEQNG